MSGVVPLFEQEDLGERFVEVALPVPLRRRFTYRAPKALGDLEVGTRVAVPFSGRKLVGVVLAHRDAPPEGVVRLKAVAGAIEPTPAYPKELLDFLIEASDYYFYPVGEVLRAAAPALPAEAVHALRREGFLASDEQLAGPRIATKKAAFAKRTDQPAEGRLGEKQRAVLALLEERPEVSLDELRAHVKGPRQIVRRLSQRGLVVVEEREVAADPFFSESVPRDAPHEPTEAQRVAIERLVAALGAGPSTHLLHGVTGSGKTEVYLRVIDEARSMGQGALLLVPEIALTPQLVSRFRARFGDGIAVLHSGLTKTQRHAAWRGLRSGALRLAVGARSALFAPVLDLGIIVVDEEHDPSFKQEDGFRYHARDMAILRAHRAGAICVLGTATPSVETRYRAQIDKVSYSLLPTRATKNDLPQVEVVDLKRHGAGPSGHPLITGPLHRALEDCLGRGEQAILFLNRRGFSPSLRCGDCGEVAECPACSVSLTEHRRASRLRCHYCDFATPMSLRCPKCQASKLVPLGLGTERLEDTLAAAFSPAKIARLDRDTAAGGRGIEAVLERVRRREIDVLVGTQMVTKGHDLPGVTLVGVVLADQSLAFPDFRASERTFQLLSQVAGRAGRGDRPGKVVFQTFQPHHPAILAAQQHDYERFYRTELEDRQLLRYAPFGRLVAVRCDAPDERRARSAIDLLAERAREQPAVKAKKVEVLGPAAAPIKKLRARYRFRMLLRSSDRRALRSVARAVAARIDEGLRTARAHVDVDPVSML